MHSHRFAARRRAAAPFTLQALSAAHRRIVLVGLAVLSDGLAILAAGLLTDLFAPAPPAALARLGTGAALCYPLFAIFNRAARPNQLLRRGASPGRAVLGAVQALTLLVALTVLVNGQLPWPAASIACFAAVLIVALAMGRAILAVTAQRAFPDGVHARAIIVESGTPDPALARDAIHVAGRFDPENPSPEEYAGLARVLHKADSVLVYCHPDRRAVWIRALGGMNVNIEVIAPELERLAPLDLRLVHGQSGALVSRIPLGIHHRIAKRLFDTAVAAAALIVLAPLMIAVAIAIRLDSPGPVLFRQPRIGRQNRVFDIYKFRSMRTDRCDTTGTASTARSDARITRVGAFIRRTSIDELPQLFNVLLGDMSIVGPRPHAVFSTAEGKLFWEVDARYWSRHSCKPGITGLAQVKGFRGATERCDDVVNRVSSDLEYVSGWSLRRDLLIVLRTLRVLVHENAY